MHGTARLTGLIIFTCLSGWLGFFAGQTFFQLLFVVGLNLTAMDILTGRALRDPVIRNFFSGMSDFGRWLGSHGLTLHHRH